MNNLATLKPFPENKYEVVKILKDDNYSKVTVRKHIKKSLCFVVKIIEENAQNCLNQIKNEISIGKKIGHHSFAKTLKSYYSSKKHYLLIEYIEGAFTLKYFSEHNKISKIRVNDFKNIITQIFNSMIESLHQNICPVDVHHENILIDFQCNVKIIDFGLYKENQAIKYHHYLYLEAQLRRHTSNLLSITQEGYQNDCFEAWKNKLWASANLSKEGLIVHYTELLQHPFLSATLT